ncbi:MAG: zinc-ribbon domain-containing protein [bacterium]
MRCTRCNFDNDEDDGYCIMCGNRLKNTCPRCHWVNRDGSKYCGKCGYAISPARRTSRYQEPR